MSKPHVENGLPAKRKAGRPRLTEEEKEERRARREKAKLDHAEDISTGVSIVTGSGEVKPADWKEKVAAAKAEEDLTAILTCGDFGGKATHTVTYKDDETGEEYTDQVLDACDRPSSFGVPGSRYGITPGRCFHHLESKLAAKAQQKATFLEKYCESPELGIQNAADATGITRPIVYWWADKDPEFRANFEAIRTIADAIVTDMVEEKVIERIMDPKSGADTLRMWFLQNRRAGKWKSAGKTGESGQQGAAASFTGGKHVHVWKMGDQTLTFE